MIQATHNNGAAVPLTPNLPKVQLPYFSKMQYSWVKESCCTLNTLTVPHEKQLLNITVVLVPVI